VPLIPRPHQVCCLDHTSSLLSLMLCQCALFFSAILPSNIYSNNDGQVTSSVDREVAPIMDHITGSIYNHTTDQYSTSMPGYNWWRKKGTITTSQATLCLYNCYQICPHYMLHWYAKKHDKIDWLHLHAYKWSHNNYHWVGNAQERDGDASGSQRGNKRESEGVNDEKMSRVLTET